MRRSQPPPKHAERESLSDQNSTPPHPLLPGAPAPTTSVPRQLGLPSVPWMITWKDSAEQHDRGRDGSTRTAVHWVNGLTAQPIVSEVIAFKPCTVTRRLQPKWFGSSDCNPHPQEPVGNDHRESAALLLTIHARVCPTSHGPKASLPGIAREIYSTSYGAPVGLVPPGPLRQVGPRGLPGRLARLGRLAGWSAGWPAALPCLPCLASARAACQSACMLGTRAPAATTLRRRHPPASPGARPPAALCLTGVLRPSAASR